MTYRVQHKVHPAGNRYYAWQSLHHEAAVKLWERLEEAPRDGQWFAVRVKKWEQPAELPDGNPPWPPHQELYIEFDVIELADRETPRIAPDLEAMPTYKVAAISLREIHTATQELIARARRWLRRRE